MPKYTIITVIVLLNLTSVFGQRVDITKQKDEVVRLHNAFRKVQRSSNMNKLVSNNFFYIYFSFYQFTFEDRITVT